MATIDEIKKAAATLFALKGYEATSMYDIAEAVGLKKQSLYSHIKGKSELYLMIINEHTESIWREITKSYEQLKASTTEEFLRDFFKKLIDVFSDRENLLLWRRTIIIYYSDESSVDFKQADWQIRQKIRDALYSELAGRHERFNDREYFEQFHLSFMVLVHGYLSMMMISGHDEYAFQCVWRSFWAGASRFFED